MKLLQKVDYNCIPKKKKNCIPKVTSEIRSNLSFFVSTTKSVLIDHIVLYSMEYIWLAKVCSGFSITSYRKKKKMNKLTGKPSI